MNKYLVIDIETKDPYIERGLDAGWVYKMNVPDSDYRVLGVAYRLHDGTTGYTLNKQFLQEQIDDHTHIIAHNASYDLGGLLSLGLNIKDKPVFDTEVMSRLFNSSLMTHGLDYIGMRYLRNKKNNQELIDSVRSLDLVPYGKLDAKRKAKDPSYKRTVDDKKCLDFAKKSLDILQELDYNVVSKYAIQDVELTYKLFDYFKRAGVDMALAEKYSFITHICMAYRLKGVRVNLKRAKEIRDTLKPQVAWLLEKVYREAVESMDKRVAIKYLVFLRSKVKKLLVEYRLTREKVFKVMPKEEKYSDHKRKLPHMTYEKDKLISHWYIKYLRVLQAYRDIRSNSKWNVASSQQISGVFGCMGIRYNEKADTSNPEIGKDWMAEQPYLICKAINEYRQANKIYKDFICAIIEMQDYTGHANDDFGRVYPSINLMRANTGRFSCSSPNIQQIPSPDRDPHFGTLCRSIFVPEEGEKWFSLDYSNQEIRIQVHYASLLNCDGADLFVLEYQNNPKFKAHNKVAELTGLTVPEAKALNLGISYGMGLLKMSKSLKCSIDEAKEMRKRYSELCPYLDALDKAAKKNLKENGYIRTLGGRRIALDPATTDEATGEKKTYEYKALNKLIQGSACDQTIEAMLKAYKEGIPVLFPVHDELCMSGTAQQARRLKEIMESAVKLAIPVVAGLNEEGGRSWAEAK